MDQNCTLTDDTPIMITILHRKKNSRHCNTLGGYANLQCPQKHYAVRRETKECHPKLTQRHHITNQFSGAGPKKR